MQTFLPGHRILSHTLWRLHWVHWQHNVYMVKHLILVYIIQYLILVITTRIINGLQQVQSLQLLRRCLAQVQCCGLKSGQLIMIPSCVADHTQPCGASPPAQSSSSPAVMATEWIWIKGEHLQWPSL